MGRYRPNKREIALGKEIKKLHIYKNICIFHYGETENKLRLTNHIDEIKEKLKNIPVLDEQEKVIGVIINVSHHIFPFIYGDVMFFKEHPKRRYFKNYEIEVNDINMSQLESISSITLAESTEDPIITII